MLAAGRSVKATKRAKNGASGAAAGLMAASLTRYSRELGISRDFLGHALHQADAVPVDNGKGHPVYRLRDVVRALAGASSLERMTPFERRAFWEAVHAENRAKEHARQLVPVHEHEEALAHFIKLSAYALQIIPDILERDGLPPAYVERVEQHVDQMCIGLYNAAGERNATTVTPAKEPIGREEVPA